MKIEKKKPLINPSVTDSGEISAATAQPAVDDQMKKSIRNKPIKLNPIVPAPTPVENTIKKLRQTLKSSFNQKAKENSESSVKIEPNEPSTPNLTLTKLSQEKNDLNLKQAQIKELQQIKEEEEVVELELLPITNKIFIVPDSLVETIYSCHDLASYSSIKITQIKIEQPLLYIKIDDAATDMKKKRLIFIVFTTILALSILFLITVISFYYIYVNIFLLIFGL